MYENGRGTEVKEQTALDHRDLSYDEKSQLNDNLTSLSQKAQIALLGAWGKRMRELADRM